GPHSARMTRPAAPMLFRQHGVLTDIRLVVQTGCDRLVDVLVQSLYRCAELPGKRSVHGGRLQAAIDERLTLQPVPLLCLQAKARSGEHFAFRTADTRPASTARVKPGPALYGAE